VTFHRHDKGSLVVIVDSSDRCANGRRALGIGAGDGGYGVLSCMEKALAKCLPTFPPAPTIATFSIWFLVPADWEWAYC